MIYFSDVTCVRNKMSLRNYLGKKWNSYKFRFLPWVVFNMTDKTARQCTMSGQSVDKEKIIKNLENIFESFAQYLSLRDDLTQYEQLHHKNQDILRGVAGFSLVRGPSSVSGAGMGVYVSSGQAVCGSVVCLYPGTVYQPYQPILLQFIFRY